MEKPYITNPIHGGKVICHKRDGFICEGDGVFFKDEDTDTLVCFHTKCFNRYEHYYGLDKPID